MLRKDEGGDEGGGGRDFILGIGNHPDLPHIAKCVNASDGLQLPSSRDGLSGGNDVPSEFLRGVVLSPLD